VWFREGGFSVVYVTDNHAHANPVRGMGFREVAERFRGSGGLAMVFAPLLSWHYSVSIGDGESFRRIYEVVVRGVQEASQHLKALAVLGVHPAEVVALVEVMGVERALEVSQRAMDIAASYVKQGYAVGLGEVGRPHYPAPRPAIEVCNKVLDYSLMLARDLSCPVHLHLDRGEGTLRDVKERVRRIGVKPELVVIHHADPAIIGRSGGLTPSIPLRGRNLEKAFSKKPIYLVESDFIDDPKRPGAVAYPWAIAQEVKRMLDEGAVSEEYLEKVFIDNFEKLYGVKLK